MTNELEQVLTGDGAALPPAAILEGTDQTLAHRVQPGAPRTIYEELWHITHWQKVTLDWIDGLETPYPVHATDGFPSEVDAGRETWDELRQRFFHGNRQAATIARDVSRHEKQVRCPSRPGLPDRLMTVRDQLASLGAHNAYHFGRIVLLRQLAGAWPPPSGGSAW